MYALPLEHEEKIVAGNEVRTRDLNLGKVESLLIFNFNTLINSLQRTYEMRSRAEFAQWTPTFLRGLTPRKGGSDVVRVLVIKK